MPRPQKIFIGLAIASVAISVAVPNQQAAAENLLDIYERALSSDPQFQQAIAERKALEEALPQALAGLRPDLSLTSSFDVTDTKGDLTGAQSDGQYRQLAYGVSLSQPLYRYSRARAVDQADARVRQAKAQFASAEQALILRVAERYFAVLDAREAVDAAEASLKAIERQLEQAEQRFEVGVIARTDVEEAKARADLARAELFEAQDSLENRREELRELTDQPAGVLDALGEGVSLTQPEPSDPTAWRERAQAENHRLAAARFAAQAAMEGIDVERGGRRPTVDLVAGYDGLEQYGRRGGDRSSDELSAGVQINWPLYEGGGISSSIREAQFRYTEAREALEETRRTVTRDAANAYRGVLTALERIDALDQARVSTRAALDATEAGFDVGTRTIVDVLNAQREVFNAERDYEQARNAYLLETFRLQRAAGTLSREDLRRVNALLGADT